MNAAGTQFLRGAEPIFIRASLRATPVLPELIRTSSDFGMAESDYPMSYRGCRGLLTAMTVVLKRLTRMLLSGQVLLLPLMLTHAMSLRRLLKDFGFTLAILISLSRHHTPPGSTCTRRAAPTATGVESRSLAR
uniref:Uncharacterized protein n=1 Tax=Solibacter usitatus (strain Ellin6076) TaxID=234267 RepID=Q01Y48_SOLUE